MKGIQLKTILMTICLAAVAVFPQQAQAASSMSVNFGTVSFGTVTLNGSTQQIPGGSGSIVVNDSIVLASTWTVSVQASQFTNGGTGSSQLTLPYGSLQLQRPTPGNSSYDSIIQSGSPWIIDNGGSPVTILSRQSLLGLLSSYSFTFPVNNAFKLTLYPDKKMILTNQTSAVYQTTITWTLTTTGIL